MDSENFKFISLAEAAKGTPYSQEYLSLLVRKGKLDGKKIGRNWFTTVDAVRLYIEKQKVNLLGEFQKKNGGEPAEVLEKIEVLDKLRINFADREVLSAQKEISFEDLGVDIHAHAPYAYLPVSSDVFANALLSAKRIFSQAVFAGSLIALSFIGGVFAMNFANEVREKMYVVENDTFSTGSNNIVVYSSSIVEKIPSLVTKTTSDLLSLAAVAGEPQGVIALVKSYVSSFGEKATTLARSFLDLFGTSKVPRVVQSPKQSTSQQVVTPTSSVSSTSTSTSPTGNTLSASRPAEVTKFSVREVVERKEIIIPADISLLRNELLSSLTAFKSSIESSINALQSSVSNVSGRTSDNFRMISVTQRIDNLDSIEVTNGINLTSGGIDMTQGYLDIKEGNITADVITAREGIRVSAVATSTLSHLSVTGDMTLGNAQSDIVFINSGTTNYNNSSTTTIPNSVVNAFSIATSTTGTSFLTFDTANSRIGIGTTSPAKTLAIAGDIYATGELTFSGGQLFSLFTNPTAHTFSTWATGVSGANATGASLVVNPSSTVPDANLIGVAVGGSARFLVDAEGDVFANSLTTVGGTTLATTTASTFTVENNTQLGDALADVVTIYGGTLNFVNFATTTLSTSTARVNAFSFATSTTAIPLLTFDTANSRLGLLTTAPTNRFDIGNGQFVVNAGGNVGIGTTTPNSILNVAGATPKITLTNTSGGANLKHWYVQSSAGDFIIATTSDLLVDTATPAFTILDTTGYVGIGTAAPEEKLSVISSSNTWGARIQNFNGSNASYGLLVNTDSNNANILGFEVRNNTSRSDFLVTTAGRVGVGTTTPGTLLSVGGDIQGHNIYGSRFIATSTTATSTLAGGLAIETSGLVYDFSTNNVGIGTVAPSRNLEILGGGSTATFHIANAGSGGTLTITANTDLPTISGGTNDSIAFQTQSTERMRITSSGIITIGEAAASGQLSIRNSNSSNPILTLVSDTNTERLRVTNDGNVGVGTTTPNWLLQVNGTRPSFALSDSSASANLKHWLFSSMGGNLYVGTSTDAYGTSTPPALTITNAGNVGIGTVAPGAPLDVRASSGDFQRWGDATDVYASITRGNPVLLTLGKGGVADGEIVCPATSCNVRIGGTLTLSMLSDSVRPGSNGAVDLGTSGVQFRTGYFLTSIIDPLLIGGSGAGSTLTLRSTSGVGSTDAIIFQVGNNGATEAMRITNSGNVGIGTTSPSELLSVSSSGGDSAYFSGEVGIGTNNPGALLDLVNSSDAAIIKELGNGSTAAGYLYNVSNVTALSTNRNPASGVFTDTARTHAFIELDSLSNNSFISFGTSPTNNTTAVEAMRITNSGNVGIGTSSPAARLSIGGGNIFFSGGQFVYASSSTSTIPLSTVNAWSIATTTTTATPHLSIDTSNNRVGIGTAAPTGAFTIRQRGTAIDDGLKLENIAGDVSFQFVIDANGYLSIARSSGNVLTVDNSGNLGIDDTTPEASLDIDSSATSGTIFGITSTGAQTTGDLVNWTANSVTTADILDISASGMSSGVGIRFAGRCIGCGSADDGLTGSAISLNSELSNGGELLLLTTGVDTSGAGQSAQAIDLTLTNSPTTNANTVRGARFRFTDTGSLANTLIGLDVDVSTANASDITYAALFNGGNLGIGTTSPAARLSVAGGNIFFSGGQFIYASSSTSTIPIDTVNAWSIATSTSATPILTVDTTGSGGIGIKTANPTSLLTIAAPGSGNVAFNIPSENGNTGFQIKRTAANVSAVEWYGSGTFAGSIDDVTGVGLSATGRWQFLGNAGTVVPLEVQGGSSQSVDLFRVASQNGTDRYFIVGSSGNVGIGTTSPATTLSVQGNALISGNLNSVANITATGTITHNAFAYVSQPASTELTDVNFNLARSVEFASGALSTQRAFRIQAPTYTFTASSTLTDASTLAITGAPIAGVRATTTNVYGLNIAAGSVIGTGAIAPTNAYGLYVNAPTGATNNYGAVFATGNVGIGTTNPTNGYALDVNGFVSIQGANPQLIFTTNNANAIFGQNTGTLGGLEIQSGNAIKLSTYQDGFLERMRITNTGNVGIGTTSPAARLSVAGGNIFFSGGQVIYASSSTSTIPNNAVNAWSIATSTSVTPVFSVDTTTGGRIGVGTAAPAQLLDIVRSGSTTAATAVIRQYAQSHVSAGPQLRLFSSRGTPSSPSAICGVDCGNDVLGRLQFAAYDGTAEAVGAEIVVDTGSGNGTWSSSGRSTAIAFYNTPTNSATLTERLRIRPNGQFDFNSSAIIFDPNNTNYIRLTDAGRIGYDTALANFYQPGSGWGILASGAGVRVNIDSDNNATTEAFVVGNNQTTGDATNNVLFLVNESGNVGIGTTSPAARLSIGGGNIFFSGGQFIYASSSTSTIPNNVVNAWSIATSTGVTPVFTIDTTNGGRVGIGTASPAGDTNKVLDIVGATNAGAGIFFHDSTSGSTSSDGATLQFANGVTYLYNRESGSMRFATNNTEYLRLSATGGLSLGNSYVATDPGAGSLIVSGNVGIGTTTPGGLLSVSGGTTYPAFLLNQTSTGDLLTLQDGGTTAFRILDGGQTRVGTTTPTGGLTGRLSVVSSEAGEHTFTVQNNATNPGATVFYVDAPNTTSDNGGTILARVAANGTSYFQVNGGGATLIGGGGAGPLGNTSLRLIGTTTSANDYALRVQATAGTDRFVVRNDGNVGIGTTTPANMLTISSASTEEILAHHASADNVGAVLRLRKSRGTLAAPSDVSNGDTIGLLQSDARSGSTNFSTAAIAMVADGTFTSGQRPPSRLEFYTNAANTAIAERMRIDSAGNVGIGTTSPVSIFAVEGSGNLDFTVNVGGTVSIAGYNRSSHYLDIPQVAGIRIGTSTNATNGNFGINIQGDGGDGVGISLRNTGANGDEWVLDSSADDSSAALGGGAGQGGRFVLYQRSGNTYALVVDPNRRLGIGTTTPNNQLTIFGATTPSLEFSSVTGPTNKWTMGIDTADANKFKIASSTAVGTNARLTIDGAGNVGIGTAAPGSRLEVNSGQIGVANGGATAPGYSFKDDLTIGMYRSIGELLFTVGNTQRILTLDVNALTIGETSSGSPLATQVLATTDGGGTNTAGSSLVVQGGQGTGTGGGGYLSFETAASGLTGSTLNTLSERVRITNAGNVGIGTTSPATTLSVQGNALISGNLTVANITATGTSLTLSGLPVNSVLTTNASGVLSASSTPTFGNFNATSTVATSTISTGGFAIGTSQFVVVGSNGRVGIGTAAPGRLFHISGVDPAAQIQNTGGNSYVAFHMVNTSQTWISGINPGGVAGTDVDDFEIVDDTTSGGNNIRLRIEPGASGAISPFIINGSGNIGIGTTTPNSRLSVANTGTRQLMLTDTNAAADAKHMYIESADGTLRFGEFNDALSTAVERIRFDDGGTTGTTSIRILDQDNSNAGFRIGYREANGDTFFENLFDNADGDFTFRTRLSGTPVNALTIKGSGNVGIGTVSPTAGGGLTIAPSLRTSGSPALLTVTGPADTTLTASTEATDVNFNLARSVEFASGALSTQRAFRIQAPTYTFTASSTLTDASTLAITGAPIAGVRATTTNVYGLNIAAGSVIGTGAIAPTNAYGLYVNAPTGATNNYGAVFATGNVGIGTTTPGRILNVFSATTNEGRIRVTGIGTTATNYSGLELYGKDGVAGQFGGGFFRDESSDDIHIFTGSDGNNPRLAIRDSSGNVGIGTTTPNWLLQAAGTRPSFVVSDTSAGANAKHWFLSSQGGNLYIGTSTDAYATTTYLTIANGGNVGIGYAASANSFLSNPINPTGNLTFSALESNTPKIRFVNADGSAADSAISSYSEPNATQILFGSNTYLSAPSSAVTKFDTSVSSASVDVYNGDGGGINFRTSSGSGSVANRMIVDFTGNVGIGTTSPAARLSIGGGNIFFSGGQVIYASSSTSTIPLSTVNAWSIATSTSVTPILSVDTTNGGRVGIGTAAPGALLNVNELDSSTTQTNFTQTVANAGILISTNFTDGVYTPGVFWSSTNSNPTIPKAGMYAKFTNSGSRLFFGTSNAYSTGITNDALIIDESGEVGIGTESPDAGLHVNESSAEATFPMTNPITHGLAGGSIHISNVNNSSNTHAALVLDPQSNSWGSVIAGRNVGAGSTALDFYTANSNSLVHAMMISAAGNVGIGTTSPATTLSVQGNALISGNLTSVANITATGTLTLSGTTGTSTIASGQGFTIGTSQFVVQQNSGNVGIGTAGPASLFTVGDNAFRMDSSGRMALATAPATTIGIIYSLGLSGSNPRVFTMNPLLSPNTGTAAQFIQIQGAQVAPPSGGTVSLVAGLDVADIAVTNVAGTVTDVFGVRVASFTAKGASATVTNEYSALFASPTNGSNNRISTVIGTAPTGPLTAGLYISGAPTGNNSLIVNSGNVGIGTSSPAARLSIGGGNIFFSGGQFIYASSSTSTIPNSAVNAWSLATSTATTPVFSVSTASGVGRVGIGTVVPQSTLEVSGALRITRAQGASDWIFQGESSGEPVFNAYLGGTRSFGMRSNAIFQLGPGGMVSDGQEIVISPSGATSRIQRSANQFIDFTGGSDLIFQSDRVDGASNVGMVFNQNTAMSTAGAKLFEFREAGTAVMTIDHAGNLGIGETAPGSKLSVSGGGSFGSGYDTTAAPTNGLIIEGNVGIGTTSPATTLSVQGNALISGNLTSVANITATGTITHNAFAYVSQPASTELTDVNFNLARSVEFASGALSTQRAFRIQAPTYTFTASSTLTDASTLAISGPPIAGVRATTTNVYGLNIAAGSVIGTGAIAPTNAYGLYVNAPTGATNNYGAVFATGNVGIGTAAPGFNLHMSYAGQNIILVDSFNASNPASQLILRGARGSVASPTAVQSDDIIGELSMRGYGATGYSDGHRAAIRFQAAENWTDTAQGAYAAFRTTPTGSTVTAEVMRLTAGGNVGIGTTTPNWLLQVNGTRPSFALSDSSASANLKHWLFSSMGGNLYVGTSTDAYGTSTPAALTITNAGNVGIGTTSPFTKFAIQESTQSDLFLTLSAQNAASALRMHNTNRNWALGTSLVGLPVGALGIQDETAASNRFVIDSSGNVGIGTTSPAARLSIGGGNIFFSGGQVIYASSSTSTIPLSTVNAWSIATTTTTATPHFSIDTSNNRVGILTAAPAATLHAISATEQLRLGFNTTNYTSFTTDSAGNLTIDTTGTGANIVFSGTGPAFRPSTDQGITLGESGTRWATIFGTSIDLTAAATISTGGTAINLTGTTPFINFSASSVGGIRDSNNARYITIDSTGATRFMGMMLDGGNVGIGTTSPNWLLQVNGTRPSFALSDSSAGANLKHWTLSSQGGNFYIATSSDAYATSSVPRITILSTGFVGIGTSSPSSELSIQGTCVDTGGGCADIAELYPASEPVEAGEIVMVDSETPGSVKKATSAAAVIGIVSTSPAMTIEGSSLQFLQGSRFVNGPLKPAIALAGRVPVRVSLEGGEIKPGDRITISSKAGIGMKATTSTYAVGIALKGFDGWTTMSDGTRVQNNHGEVLVFVNLGYAKVDEKLSEIASSSVTSNQLLTTNAWSVDQSSGRVNVGFYGDVDMNGNSIINVRQILGMDGKWKISEDGTLTAVRVVTDEVIAASATIGSAEKPAGITLFDEDTGQPYCVKVKNGVVVNEAGVCGAAAASSAAVPDLNISSSNIESQNTETASTTPTTTETQSETTTTEPVTSETTTAEPVETIPAETGSNIQSSIISFEPTVVETTTTTDPSTSSGQETATTTVDGAITN